jgi:hypothetical protein
MKDVLTYNGLIYCIVRHQNRSLTIESFVAADSDRTIPGMIRWLKQGELTMPSFTRREVAAILRSIKGK